ncbi:transcriptional regulator, LysR family [sediment metagenome]|uniref:Transcriptional regulator, LysR family n=1 Tax=sediment metagenome TaxID=749907 RepID=D9PN41_9ZZZZ
MKLPKQFYYKKNRLQQLKGFYYTVQTGSVSQAAEKMGLNQSTVTLQIQSLERDLKTQLLDRTKKKIKPNQDGEIFYHMVAYYLNGIDSLYEEFLNKKTQATSNVVNIATHNIAISHLLPTYIKKFQEQYPNATIGIKNITSDEAIKRLYDDEVDFILYPDINPPSELFSQVCFAYNPVLVMHKDHPLAKKRGEIELKDISNYNTIRVEKRLITLPVFEKMFEELKFKSSINFENGNCDMVKNFVKAEIGLGFVSELCVDKDDKDLIYKKINKYFPVTEYKLVMKNGKKPSILAESFVKILVGK